MPRTSIRSFDSSKVLPATSSAAIAVPSSARVPRDHGLLVPEGDDARSGGCDGDVVVPVRERIHVVLDDRIRIIEVSAVDVHLRTTRLTGWENNFVTEAFQDVHGRSSDPRVHRVDDAR
jgi:hypothetical protein